MEKIVRQEKKSPKTYRVIRMEKVGDYLFIETDFTSLLLDGEKCYDVGKYNRASRVFTMCDDLVAVLEIEGRQELINVKTKDVILSHRNSYYSGLFKIDDNYVRVMGPDYGDALYNVRTRKFVHPQIDLNLKYKNKIEENLFQFQYNDDERHTCQNFVLNQNGDVIYECGNYFPYFSDGNLILKSMKEKKVIIVHNPLDSCEPTDILIKNEKIQSNPLVYIKDDKADGVVFVSDNKLKMFNFNLEEMKSFPLDADVDDYEIQLWSDIAVVIVTKGENKSCIALNLNNGIQIKHNGIWILPLDVPGQQVIRGCDVLGKEDYLFTLYNEEGIEYAHHQAFDCFNVHSKKMNKYIYRRVDRTNKNLIYNIDTKEEILIPWQDLKYKTDEGFGYQSIGCGIRYRNSLDEGIIDFVDEDLNVIFGDIKCKDFGIRYENFRFDISNNLLLLTIPKSVISTTYFRKVVIDKESNVLYDSYSGNLSFIGNYLQIVESDKTTYIDSRTMNMVTGDSLISEMNLPETLQLEGKPIQLIKK